MRRAARRPATATDAVPEIKKKKKKIWLFLETIMKLYILSNTTAYFG